MDNIDHATDETDLRQPAPRVYTVNQLADILQIDPRAVRTKAKAGTWPHLDLGPKTIRFTDNHLNTILASAEATPPPERPARRRTRRPSL
ncbi:hypothetical protein ACS5PJ_14520 [Pseudarthrobacter sp. YS3]|uniref:hypothetical protein n=1 Tax=Pseudarthrobacter sp. YS3 TaxID=3453718 RepID=UPI003EEAF0B2